MISEDKFKEYIKNKRVVFVGPSPNLIGKEQGEFIDGFDVVIRTNGAINFLNEQKYIKDYGKRCDILYINNQWHRNNRPIPVSEYRRKGVKVLCFKFINEVSSGRYSKFLHVRNIKKIIRRVSQSVPSSSMGNFIWADILDKGPSELYVLGVDFFSSRSMKDNKLGIHHEYIRGYLMPNILAEMEKLDKNKTKDGHDFLQNAQYTQMLYKKYNNMKFPDYLKELLEGIVDGKIKQPE